MKMASPMSVLVHLVITHASALRPERGGTPHCPPNTWGAGTKCYADPWINDMVVSDPDGQNKVFVDVGCNTGIDAVLFLSRWGVKHDAAQVWSKELSSRVGQGACGENYRFNNFVDSERSLFSRLDWAVHSAPSDPIVLCVEPMPANVRLLHEVNQAVFGPDSPVEIISAAASDSNGAAFFPDGGAGKENQILSPSENPGTVSVQVTTVDTLLSERNIKTVDILTIDTEGFDPAVVRGAMETLRYRGVRYLTFEVHQDLVGTPWYNTTIFSVIDVLDEEQFDCYWAGNAGSLRLITGCLGAKDEDFGVRRVGWSNVACVRRGDKWEQVLKKYSVS